MTSLKDDSDMEIPSYPSLEVDSGLTPEQSGIAHTTKMMIENHTCLAGFYYRYVLNMAEFFRKMIKPSEDAYSPVGIKFFRYLTPKIVKVIAIPFKYLGISLLEIW